jgi:hypothetical protein
MVERLNRTQGLVVLVALAIVVTAWLPSLQGMATRIVDENLKNSLITFGSLRALNGFIAMAQGTEVAAGPVIGQITIAIGQVLAPVSDLLEQASTVLMWATVSLGIQKAMLVLCGNWVVSALITMSAIGWATAHLLGKSYPLLNRLMLLMFLLRFVLPVMAIGSHVVFTSFFGTGHTEAQQEINSTAAEAPIKPQSPAWHQALTSPRDTLDKAKQIAQKLPDTLLRMTVSFLIQTIVLPLFMLWALVYAGRGLFKPATMPQR